MDLQIDFTDKVRFDYPCVFDYHGHDHEEIFGRLQFGLGNSSSDILGFQDH